MRLTNPALFPRAHSGAVLGDQIYAEAYWPPTSAQQSRVSNEELRQSGMALVCSEDAPNWLQAAASRAAQEPASRRIEVEITRKYLGIAARPRRYVIFIIPPHP